MIFNHSLRNDQRRERNKGVNGSRCIFSSLASYLEHWYSWCRVGKLDLFGVLENPDFGFQVTAVSSGLLSWSASFTYPAS